MSPLEIISFGGGKQTVYLTITALEGKYGKGVDKIYFSNIKGCELKATVQYVEWFNNYIRKRFNREITFVNTPSLYDNIIDYVNGKTTRVSNIPMYTKNDNNMGVTMRQCTPDYKIAPINRQIKKDFGKGVNVNVWLGISYEEMQRMSESTVKWKTHYYPLFENKIRLSDILKWFKQNNLPIPPKSSCIFCPFHNDAYWIELYIYYPEEFEKAVFLDDKIRHYPKLYSECYLHYSRTPLKEIIYTLLQNKEKLSKQNNLFGEMVSECYAHCGT